MENLDSLLARFEAMPIEQQLGFLNSVRAAIMSSSPLAIGMQKVIDDNPVQKQVICRKEAEEKLGLRTTSYTYDANSDTIFAVKVPLAYHLRKLFYFPFPNSSLFHETVHAIQNRESGRLEFVPWLIKLGKRLGNRTITAEDVPDDILEGICKQEGRKLTKQEFINGLENFRCEDDKTQPFSRLSWELAARMLYIPATKMQLREDLETSEEAFVFSDNGKEMKNLALSYFDGTYDLMKGVLGNFSDFGQMQEAAAFVGENYSYESFKQAVQQLPLDERSSEARFNDRFDKLQDEYVAASRIVNGHIRSLSDAAA